MAKTTFFPFQQARPHDKLTHMYNMGITPPHTSKSVKVLIFSIVGTSILSPIITFMLSHFFQLLGPQNYLPLSYPFLHKGMLFQCFSYAFVHSLGVGIGLSLLFSLFFHMLLLWFVGSEICQRFGQVRFVLLFLSAILFSGIICAATLLFTKSFSILYGSTPAIFALLAVWAMCLQDQKLNFFLFLQVKAKTLVLVIFAFSLLINLSYGHFLLFLAEISGIAWGLFFGRFFLKLTVPYQLPSRKERKHADIIDITPIRQEKEDQAFLDEMLDKIAKRGLDSLTDSEKRRMDRITRRK